jgi:Cu/Ag efflux pump CusA
MAIINKGKTFANGEQLTADKFNQVIDNATFTTSAVDNVSTQLSSGAIVVLRFNTNE